MSRKFWMMSVYIKFAVIMQHLLYCMVDVAPFIGKQYQMKTRIVCRYFLLIYLMSYPRKLQLTASEEFQNYGNQKQRFLIREWSHPQHYCTTDLINMQKKKLFSRQLSNDVKITEVRRLPKHSTFVSLQTSLPVHNTDFDCCPSQNLSES